MGLRTKAGLAVVCAVLLGGCTWPMMGFDAGRSGGGNDPFLSAANVSSLQPLWSSNVPGQGITGTTAPVQGLVVGDGAVFTTADNRLLALEQGGGQQRWDVDGQVPLGPTLAHEAFAPPAFAGHTLYAGEYFTCCTKGFGPGLNGYDASTGKIVWSGTFPGPEISGPMRTDALTLVRSDVVVGHFFFNNGTASFSDIAVYNADGSARMIVDDPNAFEYALGPSTLFADGGKAFDLNGVTNCAVSNPDVVSAPLCEPVWSTNPATFNPTVVGSTLFATTSDSLLAFPEAGCGQTTCTPLWSGSVGATVSARPAVANGRVFVANDQGALKVFPAGGCGASTCNPLWSASGLGAIKTQPSVVGDVVFVGSNNGTVYAFNANGCGAATCTPLWHADTGAAINVPPAIGYGHLYVGNDAGTVHAYAVPAH